MQTPTLRDVLWEAQDRGRCWICNGQMAKKGGDKNPRAATIDHLWPRKHFGRIGDVIPSWWLEMAAAEAGRHAASARVAEVRRDICATFAGSAA